MKTDDLIDLLAEDAPVRLRLSRALGAALAISVPLSAAILVATIGIRPDLGEALQTARVIFKIAVTLMLAVTASRLVFNVGKPGVALWPYLTALLIPLCLLVLGVVAELFVLPSSLWEESMVGHYANYCLFFIPLLSLAPFVVLLWALRGGAPEKPGFAGAAAGLAAGGLGAAIYAWHCPDDSPLFVACWYIIAIAFVTLCGYFAGRRWLTW
ncbi:DUF1109 family protein [Rhizobium leguminosarum]|uniref:NrsF family protein n=1 Tax=Rhizobium ruizarguesonis TaxID=2081791 RepID=UPI00103EC52D|nr:NrsF family protein [Rhizobium ruizarguesonis]NEI05339.1 DUF1109 family protein [Rhizobium ruizarguesonis]TCA15691.1 DUF1109 family protein [Rhizobium leguminosarum bv. viciae]